MRLLRGSRSEKLDQLVTMAIVLAILLIILAAAAVLSSIVGILGRFRQQIFMFIFGALLAYLMIPLVNLLQRAVRVRWAAIASSYLLLFLALIVFGVLLLNPFISQSRSLVRNLRSPAAGSLQRLQTVRNDTKRIQTSLQHQQQALKNGQSVSKRAQQQAQGEITALQGGLDSISSRAPAAQQIQIPPSYVTPIQRPAKQMASAYRTATLSPGAMDQAALGEAVTAAKTAVSAADTSYKQAAATPILLLNAQTWLDNHGVIINLHDKFGNALQQLSKQLSSILNNALGIVLQAGNLLLNTVLILIISVYFISDGARFVRWCVTLAPVGARPRVRFFLRSLDQILGTYLRTQVLLAALAATLDTSGAVVLGIPYAIVIFFSSFLLSLIPVIGPVILPFPPMIIALIFTPLPRPLFYLPWLLIGEQIATNIIGPRVQGQRVGIHPLEAMAAALLGFPIAGFVGAFFAVPVVSFLHIVAREAIHSARHESVETEETVPGVERPGRASREPSPADGTPST